MRHRNGSWNASWAAPPARTPHARAVTGSSKRGASPIAAAMSATLSRLGVIAGIPNRPQVLRIPPANAVSEMNRR